MVPFLRLWAPAGLALAAVLAGATPALAQDGGVDALCRAVIATPAPAGDASVLMLKGDCALALGAPERAADFYAAALAAEPSNLMARSELARVLLVLGRGEEARPHLAGAATSNPGNAEAGQMADLAAQLPVAAQPGSWHGSIAVSRGYDSNVNGGTLSSTFDAIIAGTLLELTIADSSRGKPDWASQLVGKSSYLHVLDADNAVVLSGSAAMTVYDQHARYNSFETTLGLGLLHQADAAMWSLTPNLRLAWQGDALDAAGFYLDGRVQMALSAQTALIGFGKLGYTLAGPDQALDHGVGQLGVGIEHSFDPRLTGTIQLVAERKASNTATQSVVQFGPRIGLNAQLSDSLALDIAYRYDMSFYDQTLPIFREARRDARHDISAGLTLDLSTLTQGLEAEARYAYQNVDSTLDLHDRDRHMVNMSLRYGF